MAIVGKNKPLISIRTKADAQTQGDLAQSVDVLLELALVVGRLVLVDDVPRGHLVQVGLDIVQHLGGLLGIFGRVQFFHQRPHFATGGAIADIAALVLTDALDG